MHIYRVGRKNRTIFESLKIVLYLKQERHLEFDHSQLLFALVR